MNKKKLNLKWVTEVIGDEYKKWRKGDIVKILAQTGTGKTYFIKSVLIPHMESWEHMLIVANRINLKRQLKKDLITYYQEDMPKSLKELDDLKTIGNVTILSYQSIAELKKADKYGLANLDLSLYDYIICDECHFFFSDGAFNNKCYLAWQELIKARHRNAIKVFISATMDEVERTIDVSVDKIHETGFGTYKNCKLFKYDTGIDYSYLNTMYFEKITDIALTIKNDTSSDKWLVFVTKKSDAEYINKTLEGKKTVNIITKDTDITENEDLQTIITDSKYKCDVLVCTKAMDNGINISDDSVKNVVIMAWDKISFIQELGRVRINIEDAPEINLYIPTMSWSAFNTLITKQYEHKENLIDFYRKKRTEFNSKYDYDYDKLPKDIFILDKDEGWKINITGEIRLIRDKQFAEEICRQFNSKRNQENKIFAYVKEQLKWIQQESTFDFFNLICEVVDDEEIETLQIWLDNHVGEKLFHEDQQEISNLIIKELITVGNDVDYRSKILKPVTLENMLRVQLKLPYAVSKSKVEDKIIDGKRQQKRYVTISKIQ